MVHLPVSSAHLSASIMHTLRGGCKRFRCNLCAVRAARDRSRRRLLPCRSPKYFKAGLLPAGWKVRSCFSWRSCRPHSRMPSAPFCSSTHSSWCRHRIGCRYPCLQIGLSGFWLLHNRSFYWPYFSVFFVSPHANIDAESKSFFIIK